MFEIILKRLYELGVLKDLIVIGSWAASLYKYYFKKEEYNYIPKTTDIDFLISIPYKTDTAVDLPEALKDLNFIAQFSGQKGYIKLSHPELSLEFLVPELGRGSDKAYPLKGLGINAQPIRYVNLLLQDIIEINYHGINIKIPHPAVFVLQKLLIIDKRKNEEKKLKDIDIAKTVLTWIDSSNSEKKYLKNTFLHISKSWQKKIIKQLKANKLSETLDFLLEE